jgi:hypothetical protein
MLVSQGLGWAAIMSDGDAIRRTVKEIRLEMIDGIIGIFEKASMENDAVYMSKRFVIEILTNIRKANEES